MRSLLRRARRLVPERARRAVRAWRGSEVAVPVIEVITVKGAWPPAAVVFPEPFAFHPAGADRDVVALDPHSDRRPILLPAIVLNDVPDGGIRPSGLIESADGALLIESVKRLSHMLENPEARRRAATTERRDGLGSTIVAPLRLTNYFHWVVDMLPRLYALEQAGDDLELVVPDVMPRFADELLERVLPDGFTVRRFPSASLVRYDAVRLSPFTTIWGKGLLRPEIAAWLRPRLLGRPLGRTGPGRRIYVSRAGAQWHRVTNEDDVLAALARHGVERARPEDLSVAEQLELFADAELIVAPHGAGLTNMLVADGAAVIELSPSGIGSRMQMAYWSLARTCGHRYVAMPHEGGRYREQFAVDVPRLERAVEWAVGGGDDGAMAAVI